MRSTFEKFINDLGGTENGALLFDAIAKLTVLLAVLLLTVVLMRWLLRSSAAQRASVLWIGALAVPVVIAACLSDRTKHAIWTIERSESPVAVAVAVAAEEQLSSIDSDELAEPAHIPPSIEGSPTATAAPTNATPVTQSQSAANRNNTEPIRWDRWAIGIWIGGTGWFAARLLFGITLLNARAHRRAATVEAGRLTSALANICKEMGVKKQPQLLVITGSNATMPMTWGACRQKILLPADAERWEPQRLQIVLRHELGHVRRRDCLAAWTMRLLLAPAWFHPLAWIVNRHATDLRERACDDATAPGKHEVDRYARELVALSRCTPRLPDALAMARPRRLEARIRALYCEQVGRREAGGIFRGAASTLLAILVLPMLLFTLATTSVSEGRAETVLNNEHVRIVPKVIEVLDFNPANNADPIQRQIHQWAQTGPGFAPDKNAKPISAATVAKLEKRNEFVTKLPAFKAAKTRPGELIEMLHTAGTVGTLRSLAITDIKVTPLPGSKLSAQFWMELGEAENPDGTGKIKIRKAKVGPVTIADGGGLVLGVTGEAAEEFGETALGRIPIIRGLVARRRGEPRRHQQIMIVSFKASPPPTAAVVAPKPIFREGEKRAIVGLIEITQSGLDEHGEQISELFLGQKGKLVAIPAVTMAQLPNYKGADLMLMPAIPVNKKHQMKIVREFIYPENPEAAPADHKITVREIGVIGEALVRPLAGGKLSVDLNFEVVEFDGFVKDAGGTDRPQFGVRKLNIGKVTIENGGGISLGVVREDVQHVEDKVPVLGDIPLLGKLFRSESENHFKRLLLVRVSVTD